MNKFEVISDIFIENEQQIKETFDYPEMLLADMIGEFSNNLFFNVGFEDKWNSMVELISYELRQRDVEVSQIDKILSDIKIDYMEEFKIILKNIIVKARNDSLSNDNILLLESRIKDKLGE